MKDRSFARLDRAARRGGEGFALCSYCNGRLAQIEMHPHSLLATAPLREVEIVVPANFVSGADGVFKRIGRTWQGRHTIRRLYAPRGGIGQDEMSRTLDQLPVKLQCPQCGEIQILDGDALGIFAATPSGPYLTGPPTHEDIARWREKLEVLVQRIGVSYQDEVEYYRNLTQGFLRSRGLPQWGEHDDKE